MANHRIDTITIGTEIGGYKVISVMIFPDKSGYTKTYYVGKKKKKYRRFLSHEPEVCLAKIKNYPTARKAILDSWIKMKKNIKL